MHIHYSVKVCVNFITLNNCAWVRHQTTILLFLVNFEDIPAFINQHTYTSVYLSRIISDHKLEKHLG